MAAGVAVNAVGRNHPKVLEAIRRQCDVIMHTTDITNPKRIELAKKVSSVMPEGLAGNCHTAVYQAGSDAVETAIKFARAYTGRSQLIAFHGAYHGVWCGTAAHDHRLQLPPRLGTDDARRAAPALRLLLPLPVRHGVPGLRRPVRQVRRRRPQRPVHRRRRRRRRGHREPAGRGRLRRPAAGVPRDDQGRLREERLPLHRRRGAVRRRAHRQDVGHPVLQGRQPDMLTWGKGMGGDMPMAGVTYRADMEEALREGSQPSTFAGNAMALRGRDDQHRPHHRPGDGPASAGPPRSARRSRACSPTPCRTCQCIGDVRGNGLMVGIEVVADRKTKEPLAGEKIGEITFKLLNRGILMTPCGRHANVFRFMPPLTIPHDYAVKATEIMIDILKEY